MRIAVITGASSGIGREFVKSISKHKQLDEIWVVARRAERLAALKDEVKTPIRAVPLDLLEQSSIEEYAALLKAEKPDVAVLVNASGFGYFHAVVDEELSGWLKMIDLNDKALVSMTYVTLPYMSEGGEVYNIASTSAFQPVPYEAVYGATKAFVLSFSRALNMELIPRKIRVMAVCPHWTKTEFFDTAVKDDTIVYYNTFNKADEVAETALKNMAKGKDLSLCGFKVRTQVFAVKHLPHRMVMRTWCKQQKKPF